MTTTFRPTATDDETPTGLQTAVAVLFGILVFVLLLGQWRPLEFLDTGGESWAFVLSEAAAGRYRFGPEILFTSGPLSDFYKRLYNPATFVSTLVLTYVFVVAQSIAIAVLAARSRSWFFPAVLVVALLFVVWRDVLLLVTPLPFALAALNRPRSRTSVALGIAGAIAGGLCTLAKFSIFPLSVGLFLLVDINRLRVRALPVATVCYIAALYLSFVFFAPSGDFLDFLRGSLETSAGYTEAMGLNGSWLELGLYGALAVAALAAISFIERRRFRLGRFGWEAALTFLALALFVWVTFKAGLVRHDLHALFAFSGLALGLCLYGLARVPPRTLGWPAALVLAAAVVGAGFYPHVRLAYDRLTEIPVLASLVDSLTAPQRELSRSVAAAADPTGWLAERTRLYETARAGRAGLNPIGALKGTVDTLPALQSALIAAGLDYRPRPTIQEYTSYSSPLIQRNRAFFTGPAAPEFLVFEPETVDNRPPTMVEGPLWPIFLSDYAPSFLAGGSVVLHRRTTPLGDILDPGESGTGRLGTPLPVAAGGDPVFVTLDVRLTLLGRLAEFLFKVPYLYLGVTMTDGSERDYRFIPGIAREGFLVSHLVQTGRDFVRLAEGTGADSLPQVKSFRVFGGWGSRAAYNGTFAYTTRTIDRARLAQGRDWSLPPEQAAAFARDRAFESLILALGPPQNEFKIISDGLFAHAPRRFPVPVAGASSLKIGFGLLPGSWDKGGASDGVCFRVLDARGNAVLWERCIDPAKAEGDRGLLRETVPLPAGIQQAVLVTDCRASCAWDWSYWGEIEPVRP